MTKSNGRILFISSTGGHLTELLQLAPMFETHDYFLITENTKANQKLKDRFGADHFGTMVYGSKSQPLLYLFRFSWNCLKSLYYFMKFRPDYIITTGTHTAVPMCRIAHQFGKKVIWIETFANSRTSTMAGRMVYPYADLFVVQWESMLEIYPDAHYGGWIF